jgi:hypothetical protein
VSGRERERSGAAEHAGEEEGRGGRRKREPVRTMSTWSWGRDVEEPTVSVSSEVSDGGGSGTWVGGGRGAWRGAPWRRARRPSWDCGVAAPWTRDAFETSVVGALWVQATSGGRKMGREQGLKISWGEKIRTRPNPNFR